MIQALAEAIAHMEGYYTHGSLPDRLNNPGDLIFANQPKAKPYRVKGKDGKFRTYAAFPTPEDGWEALRRQIRLDASRGLTLSAFIQKYAPASDGNDPDGYAAFVAGRLGGVALDTPLSKIV